MKDCDDSIANTLVTTSYHELVKNHECALLNKTHLFLKIKVEDRYTDGLIIWVVVLAEEGVFECLGDADTFVRVELEQGVQ